MAAKSGGFPWTVVIIGVGGYFAYKFLTNATAAQAAGGGLSGGSGTPGILNQPLTPQGTNLQGEIGAYVSQQLQNEAALQQQLLQDQLNGGGGSSTSSGGGSSTSSGSGVTNGEQPPTMSWVTGNIKAIEDKYAAATSASQRATLHAQAENIRLQAQNAGLGALVYNPNLGYAQLVTTTGATL